MSCLSVCFRLVGRIGGSKLDLDVLGNGGTGVEGFGGEGGKLNRYVCVFLRGEARMEYHLLLSGDNNYMKKKNKLFQVSNTRKISLDRNSSLRL